MHTSRIGQILNEMGVLSDQDVADVLEQQRRTGQKFGQIALAWGLARPEQVWEAWCHQLIERGQRIDLDDVGIDTRAAGKVDYEYAVAHRLLPVRLWGDQLVVALAEPTDPDVLQDLGRRTGCRIHHCFCELHQLEDYIERAYACMCV